MYPEKVGGEGVEQSGETLFQQLAEQSLNENEPKERIFRLERAHLQGERDRRKDQPSGKEDKTDGAGSLRTNEGTR